MKDEPALGAIATLLDTIAHVKGPIGAVRLCCIHWFPRTPQSQGIATSRGVKLVGAPEPEKSVVEQLVSTDDSSDAPLGISRDGKLTINEHIRFEGMSPRSGYIHLFNLGTSGACLKLAPSDVCPDNRIEANKVFEIPSAQFMEMDPFADGAWYEQGPTTAEAGYPERILVILTQSDIELHCSDLHPDLNDTQLGTPRGGSGPGFGGPARRQRAKLFTLPPDVWDFGLISLEVEG